MKLISFTSIVLALLFLFVGCVSTQKDKDNPMLKDSPKTSDTNIHLLQTHWKLFELNGKKITDYPAQNQAPFIHLNNNKEMQGTGGCNSMNGHYELKDENGIIFTNVIVTEMACQGMELETDFYPFLSLVRSFAIIDSTLTLSNEDGSVSAMFKASDSR